MEARGPDSRGLSGLRVSLRETAGTGRGGISDREGIREQRPAQSYLLHGGKPGAVSPILGEGGVFAEADSGQLRVFHGRFVWAVPFRHVRGGVSLRAEEC